MKKTLAWICLLLLAFGTVSVAQAAEISLFASECIRSTTIMIEPKAGGVIDAAVSINCNQQASTLGFTVFAIQEKQSDGTWKTVKSTSSLVSNALNCGLSLTYSGAKAGTQYRATATAKCVYNGTTEYRYPQTSGQAAKP